MDIYKNIKWLYAARMASLTGSQILFFVVPLLIYKLSNNVFYSGLAFSIEWLARIISFPLSGLSADRFGSKRVYITTDLIIGIICGLSILLITYFPNIAIINLIVLSTVAGFLSEQGYVSAESLAPKLVPVNYYPKSQSILESLELLALLFGPLLAGLFILYFKIETLIAIAMFFYICSALAMKNIKAESLPVASDLTFVSNLLSGFRTIANYPYLINLVLLAMLINMLFGLMTGSAAVMVIGIYKKSDTYYALLNFVSGIFGISFIISFNYLLKYFSIVKVGTVTFLLACISCILLGFTQNFIIYVILYAFFYGVNGLFSIFFRSERARIIPTDILGRTIGAIIFLTFLLFPISGLLISLSQKFLGLQNLIMVFGIICLSLGLPILRSIQNLVIYRHMSEDNI